MKCTRQLLMVIAGIVVTLGSAEAQDPAVRRGPVPPVRSSSKDHSQTTLVGGVTFESLNLPYGSQIDPPDGVPTTVDGFTFTPGPNNNSGLNDSHFGNAVNFWGFNGTHVMDQHDDVIMTKANGSTFSLSSFDFTGFPQGAEVPFTVTGQPGNIVVTFIPDGLVDGSGGVEDFQTFTLPPTFINLTSVTWQHTGPGTIAGIFGLDNIMVDVVQNLPPDCSKAVASEPELWPPNHKYHAISILGVTDPDGDPVTINVTSITQDEPVNGRGDGNSCPDAQITAGNASVRAERTGTPGVPGNGRVYAINFTASDGRGGECAGVAYVCVPHDHGHSACIDDGQRFNSLGPCGGGNGLAAEVIRDFSLRIGAVTSQQALIEFALPSDEQVQIGVFDVAGRQLATVENERLTAGTYQRAWNTDGVSNGVYFVRMRAGDATLTKVVFRLR